MDARTRHRLLLSLRSEQALGLKSVRRRQHVAQAVAETIEDLAVEKLAPAEVEEAPRPAGPELVRNLFGAAAKPAGPPTLAARAVTAPSAEPFSAPLLSTAQKRTRLAELDAKEVTGCTKCQLCKTRTKTVFGEGDPDTKIFFVGEGPGENEDQTGRPFVGRAGQLLDKMIAGMGLKREQVFIANIVKCRPPGNRVPMPDEVATCTPYLERQLEIVRPDVIVTLGLPAAKHMLGDSKLTMGKIRGQWREWRGIKLMPTFHPSYVLRVYTDETRAAVWSDLKQVMEAVGLPVPKQGK